MSGAFLIRANYWRIAALTLVLQALLGHPAQAQDWREISSADGITVEARQEAHSSFETIRARAHVPTSPDRFLATVWSHGEYTQFVPYLKRLEILRDSPTERILYEQIGMPVVSDRDGVVRARVEVDDDAGVRRVLLDHTTDPSKPEQPGFVRIKFIHGGWTIRRAPDGGSEITYEMLTDPGGSVPAWVVKLAQREAPAKLLRSMIAHSAQAHRASAAAVVYP